MATTLNIWIFPFRFLCLSMVIFLTACSDKEATPVPTIELDILAKLESIENITVVELEAVDHFTRLFEIRMEQPVDHNNPAGTKFTQKIFLGHVDEALPVVLETEGYVRDKHRTRELSPILGGNQLTVEHRYFGTSTPNPRDWQYLNIWQAANDHHRIVETFKDIYPNSWVSSGRSKGGDAAIFHRRFFPDDVDATLAYVAPLLFEQQDQRFLSYYNRAGDKACREKMKHFQRNILMKLDSIPTLFDKYVKSVGDFGDATRFSLSYKDIVYHATRKDYAFEFWSSETENCTTIPDENATAQELLNHFVGVFDVFLFFSDFGVNFWTPYCYQALTELGNYAYDVRHLEDLQFPISPLSQYNAPTDFDPSVMLDIQSWISTSASEIVFIYGEDDPWTVAAVDIPASDKLVKIVNPRTKHSTDLSSLTSSDRTLVLDRLKEWMED